MKEEKVESEYKYNEFKEKMKKDFFDDNAKRLLVPMVNMFFTFFVFNMVFCFFEYGKATPLVLADILFSMYLGSITYMFLLGIFGRTLATTIVYNVLACTLMFINKLKIMYVGEPIYFSDVKFLVNLVDLSKLAFGNMSFKTILVPLFPTFIMAVWTLLMIFLNWRYRSKLSVKSRVILLVATCIAFLVLAHPTRLFKEYMNENIYKIDDYEDFNSYVDNKSYYYYYGFASGMYGNYLNKFFFEPLDYDEEKVNEALNGANIKSTGEYGNPNIILWLSESFFDIQNLEGVEFYEDPIPNFHEYLKIGKPINVLSPSYGGASENVAFELLTGGNMKYFPNGYIPIMSLYDSEESSKIPSIVQELRNNKYKTSYIFGKDYYNSKKAYMNMGFDNYVDLSKEYGEPTDKIITEEVIKLLDKKDRQFITVASYEAHMPYNHNKYRDYDVLVKSSSFTIEEIETIKTYGEAIHRADEQLKVLYEYIQTIEEPTIIIFIPDHLPYLYTSNNKDIMKNYILREDGKENYFKKYNNKGVLLANYDVDFSKIPDYLGADQLLNTIVQQTEVELGPYYDYLYSNIDLYAGMNRFVLIEKDGDVFLEDKKSKKIEKVDYIRRDMQYKLFLSK